jgi:biopolymer transport protein ExbD
MRAATLLIVAFTNGVLTSAQAQAGLTVQVFSDGNCGIADTKIPCAQVGAKLLAMRVPLSTVIDLKGDLTVAYKPVAAAGASLKDAGYRTKVAYITTDGGKSN